VSDPNETKTNGQYLFNMVEHRYGNRLAPGEIDDVQKSVDGILQAADALRSVKLKNSDEPFIMFVPYRKEA
jgi:hypothetical protein